MLQGHLKYSKLLTHKTKYPQKYSLIIQQIQYQCTKKQKKKYCQEQE